MNRIILDEKSLGEVKVESKIFTSSRMDRIFLTQGSHSIKYAHTWGHVALDKLVISPSGQTNTMATDNPFEDPIATIKELEKEVFRLTLKLDETGKCSYKIERTKKPLSENYEGQVIDVFPNAKSWRAKDGTVTTIHDFSKHVSLDDLFLPRDDKSKERLSLEKSTGRLMMQYGPGLYWDGGCTANYAKKMLLPIEVVVDVAEIEVRDKSFGSDFIIFYGTENTSLRFVFNGAQMYVNRAEQNTSEKTIYHHNCRDFQAEGSFDFPKTEITRAFSFGFQSFTGQKRTGKNGLSMIVTKGRFFDGESNASDTDNPFDEPVATDNPFAE